MRHFTSLALFASIVACAIPASLGTTYPILYYMDGNCFRTITVAGDARVQISSKPFLAGNRNCSIYFKTSTGSSLTAKFLTYSISSDYTSATGYCPFESIQLYNVLNSPQLATRPNYCGSRRPVSNFDLGTSGRLQLLTGNYLTVWTTNMDLLVSEISYRSSFTNSTCPSRYFDCGNTYCVSRSLTCNGYDDCGNNADEDDVCGNTPLTKGVIGGIVGGIVFVIIVSVVSLLLCRRHRLRISLNVQRF